MTAQIVQKKCLNCERTYPPETVVCEQDGTPLAAMLSQSLVGDTLSGGKYELQEELGRGGMGVVFRARHKLMDRVVAIKMLVDDMGRDDTAQQRFLVEAKAAAALNHPNIIRIYDFDVSQHGFPFIVMDYLQGEPLDAILEREQRLDWRRAVPLFIKVCEALGHAHRRQVVHRDIKPSNIMVVSGDDDEEKPVVLDFGIAKLFSQGGKSEQRLTRTGEIFGSPLYMSPEQCMGQATDTRSDIYSLGCLMFETLTGEAPFERSGFLQVILAHINDPVRRLEQVAPNAGIPPALSDVISRSMAKGVDERFESMHDFKRALATLGNGQNGATPGGTAEQNVLAQATGTVVIGAAACESRASSGAPGGAGAAAPQFDVPSVSAGSADALDKNSVTTGESRRGKRRTEFEQWLSGAEAGSAEDQYDLAWSYREGDYGAPKDAEQAFFWIMKAAKQGHVSSMVVAAEMLYNGEGTQQNLQESFKLRRQAADLGDAFAQGSLGWMYEKGEGCLPDPELAAYWYRQAAEQELASAQCNLGFCYATGLGVEQSDTDAFRWYMKAAKQGDHAGQRNVADCLQWGRGVEIDEEAAFDWYKAAAEQGELAAQYQLARMLFEGAGCKQDAAEARKQLRQAAQKDHAEAQNYLALCYEWGWHDYPVNVTESITWYKRAAEQDFAEAFYNLGVLYEDGKGFDQNDVEALRHYKKAAELGHGNAMTAYARFLKEGIGCSANRTESLKWLKQAMAIDNAWALLVMSRLLQEGEISDPSLDAFELMRRAAQDETYLDAQYEYAMMLIDDEQQEEGLVYLRRAADGGHQNAIDALADYE